MKIFLCILLCFPTLLFAKNIAVLQFKNNTGKTSLQFMSFTLAEVISNKVVKLKNIQIIERNRLKSILKEFSMKDSGIADQDSIKELKLLNADYFIFGSYQGNKKLTVILKIVEVSSGKVISSEKVRGTLESVMPLVEIAALRLCGYITGEKLFCLSVDSTPDNASIYINDMYIGKTPLVCHKIPKGNYTITVIKADYIKRTENVYIQDKSENINVTLISKSDYFKRNISFGFYYFDMINISKSKDYMASFGAYQRFKFITLGLEYNQTFGNFEYSNSFDVPYAEQEDTRDVYIFNSNINALYTIFTLEFLSPYAGIQIGYNRFFETKIDNEYTGYSHKGYDVVTYGIIGGINILPYSKVSIFGEFRYIDTILSDERDKVNSIYMGNVNISKEKVIIRAFQFGGGLRFYF